MRIVRIAVFMLIFTMTMGALDGLGLFGGGVSIEYESSELVIVLQNGTNYTIKGVPTPEEARPLMAPNFGIPIIDQIAAIIWQAYEVFRRTWYLLENIFSAAFLTGQYLKSLIPIIPDSLANLITTVVNVTYIAGIVQWFTGRSFKQLE